ncbi:MAG TPA: hypothetical protein GXX63_02125 [Tissierellia bacterium]|nr:hypothetical protein [Tissierellia bacterium]
MLEYSQKDNKHIIITNDYQIVALLKVGLEEQIKLYQDWYEEETIPERKRMVKESLEEYKKYLKELIYIKK